MLLAKSNSCGHEVTLTEHTQDVCDAAEALFGSATDRTRLGEEWVRFFRIGPADFPAFAGNLLAAGLFHDWGKANADMQRLLKGGRGEQLFRHEHLSVLMLGYDGVDRWVRQRADIDWDVVLAAVGSHHLKFSDAEFAPTRVDAAGRGRAVEVLTGDDSFRGLADFTAARLGLAGRPEFPRQPHWGFARGPATFPVESLRDGLRDGRLRDVTRACRSVDAPRHRMLNAVRAALIAADAAGSGLRRTGRPVGDWVRGQFPDTPQRVTASVQGIIDGRMRELSRPGRAFKWNEFQDACAGLPDRALLLAPCGSGKTLAAWRWVAARRAVNRVLFLYPTRATATEGFKDYVSWAPEADAALIHGTADYDLEGMFPAEDPRRGGFAPTDPRLFALQHWTKHVFSATADQFLAFLSYGYGPVCLLPLLADSVVVVDEVHSFDRKMFSALLGFLKAFDVPVLCMTATLQSGRRQQLEDAGLTVYADRPGELTGLAEAPRYQVARLADESAAGAVVRAAVAAGKRVLWVVNQVSRCQQNAARLAATGVPTICYHSRFKLTDRRDRHRETVRAVRPGQPAVVVVSTQVCEMSLDIDADVLVTEECPITSLIQRMGRCRRGREELAEKGPGEVFIYKPTGKEAVYSTDDLAGLDGFVTFVAGKPAASQADLEEGLEQFGPTGADAPRLNQFLASGPYALAGDEDDSFRDIEEFNAQAVLDSDVEEYLRAGNDRKPGYVVPVPRKLRPDTHPQLPHYLRVGRAANYDPQTGYWDAPLTAPE